MEDKSKLIRIAGQLKDLADELLECAKEKKEDDDKSEDEKDSETSSSMFKALKLSKKIKDY